MVEQVPSQGRASTQRGSSILRSYAWLIALLGVFVLIGSGIIYLFSRSWKLQAEVGSGLGIVLLLGAVLLRPDAVRTALAGRPVKYASNALVMTLAFIGIVGLVNVLAVKNRWEYDVTENAQFTLSPQTIKILEKLDKPVQVIGFFQTGDPRQDLAEDYLQRSSQYTNFLSYEFHDPNVEPTLAHKYELSHFGLVFLSGDNRIEAHNIDEETVTSSLIRVTSEQEKQVFFLTGHGEPDIADASPEGYSLLKQALERENYVVETINVAAVADGDTLLSDSSTLILAGAQQDLSELEVAFLTEWMETGGRLMLLANPLEPIPLSQTLYKYGLSVGNDLVADVDSYLAGLAPTSPLLNKYPYHEITQGLNGYQTFFPLARSLTLGPADAEGVRHTSPILTTSPNSWAEIDLEEDELEFNEGIDRPGPIHIGAASENRKNGTRLVVFGSADFVGNQVLKEVPSNRDLFMNAVNWLSEEEDLISIRPKEATNRTLFLTPVQHTITVFTSLIVIPLAIFLAGGLVWWKRR